MLQLLDALRPWQGFYSLVGTASATLVGLLFVAASVGSGIYTPEKRQALRAFLSPTVFHFSSVLAACLMVLAPIQSWKVCGILVVGEALVGLLYAAWVGHTMVRHGLLTTIDLEDRVWYAALPAFGYGFVGAAGCMLLDRAAGGCELLAIGLCLLLLIGLRNAWDMTLWTATRRRE